MKKLLLVSLVGMVLVCTFIFISSIFKNKKKLETLSENLSSGLTNEIIEDYFYAYNHYPSSLNDSLIKQRNDTIINSDLGLRSLGFLIDPFSEQTDTLLIYIPLHNRKTDHIEGYVLLSRGIDGIRQTPDMKLYTDNYKSQLSVYNDEEMLNSKPSTYGMVVSCGLNPVNYFFGKKDLFILSWDLREYYYHVPRPTIELCENPNNIYNFDKYYISDRRTDSCFTRKIILQLSIPGQDCNQMGNIINCRVNDYVLLLKMIDMDKLTQADKKNQCIQLIGYLQSIDPAKKELIFTNTIFVKN